MPEPAEQPEGATHRRSLTWFYVVMGVVIALTLFGAWFWKTWNVWWFDAAEARRRQNEAAAQVRLPVETEVDLGDGVKMELVLVPPGRFRMGSPAEEADRSDDERQHWVIITKPFYIGKYEVTQEQWEKVMGKNPSAFKGPKNPVEVVSWDECQEFLKKLNERRPHPVPLPAAGEGAKRMGGLRLPTEAEWEWACRAGTRTRFCSGDADAGLAEHARFSANAGSTTHPVGTRQPNAWGLHDMHGNGWEWCGDWYDEYPKRWKPHTDPTGPATGSARVLRGGAWYVIPGVCRSACRYDVYPACRIYLIGFRVVGVAVSAGP